MSLHHSPSRTVPWLIAAAILLALYLLPAQPGHAETKDAVQLTFGVYQADRASIVFKQFHPLIAHVEKQLASRLGAPTTIRMRIFKTYDDGIEAISTGQVDFVRLGPCSFITARAHNSRIRLLAMESVDGQKRFKGIIIVRSDSDITELSQLRGRKFAFGDRNSTIGRYLAQAELMNAGIQSRDLAGYDYLDRHDKVAKAVLLGDYDAGSIKAGTFRHFSRTGRLRALHTFENVTKPWVAREGLPEDIFQQLQLSLLELEDPATLGPLKISRFLPATLADYELVFAGMEFARQFQQ